MEETKKSTRLAAGEALLELVQEGQNVVAVSADTSKSMCINLLRDAYPERCFDTGIAEQNMMMVAAGLASTGKIAFATSYSVFTSMRCSEQIRTFIAYPNLNVNIIAGLGGLSAGIEGPTHIATEDIGIMRCISNLAVVAPSDYIATKKAIKAAAKYQGPVYIRVGRDATPIIHSLDAEFEIGMPIIHQRGNDVTVFVTGLVTAEVLKAINILENQKISVSVVELHTLKPVFNTEIIIQEAARSRKIVTVEEHNIVGGLATVIAEILAGKFEYKKLNLGLEDAFAESGTPAELYKKYSLDADSIADRISRFHSNEE